MGSLIKKAPQADAQEEAQEDAEAHPLPTASPREVDLAHPLPAASPREVAPPPSSSPLCLGGHCANHDSTVAGIGPFHEPGRAAPRQPRCMASGLLQRTAVLVKTGLHV